MSEFYVTVTVTVGKQLRGRALLANDCSAEDGELQLRYPERDSLEASTAWLHRQRESPTGAFAARHDRL
jgi:hypothetical protein